MVLISEGGPLTKICRLFVTLTTLTALIPPAAAQPTAPAQPTTPALPTAPAPSTTPAPPTAPAASTTPAASITPAASTTPETAQYKAFRHEGKTCYRKRDYNCALDRFEKAFALAPAPAMLFNIASAQDKLGLNPLAVQNYRRYLQQSGVQASPQGLLHIQRRLKQLLPRVARVQLTLQAPEAKSTIQTSDMQVTLDDNPVDLTWMRVQSHTYEVVASPGVHRLQVSAPGHEPYRETLTLTAGKQTSRTIQLKITTGSNHGTLHLTSIPSGARIWIDGHPLSQLTPAEIPHLTVGNHQVKVATAQLVYQGQITITAGATASLQAELLPHATSSSLLTSDAQLVNKTGSTQKKSAHPIRPPPLLPHLNSTFPLEAGELGNWVAFHLDLTSAQGATLYSLGLETRYTFVDRVEVGFHLPFLIQRVASSPDGPVGKSYFGDLRLKLKTRLFGDRQRDFVLSGFLHGDLPTNSLELENRAYTILRPGLATTVWVKGFTLGGDIGVHFGIGSGLDWVIPLANVYLGKELGYGFGLQFAVQFAQAVKPLLDEPSLALAPTLTFALLPALQVSAGLQLCLTDVGRHTYNYSARALFLMDLRYHF